MNDDRRSNRLPDRLAALWTMDEIRKHPLEMEKIASGTAPFIVKGVNDWMSTGDSWVGSTASAGARPAPANETSSDFGVLAVDQYYFSSEVTDEGPNRIYAALAKPESAQRPLPAIVVFHGGGGHASPALSLAIARKNPGTAVLSVDYNGQDMPAGNQKTTIWRNVDREIKPQLIPDPRNYRMYHYVVAARRAMDLLAELPGIDSSRVGCFGISYGGWVALILAGVDERVKCVVNAVSAGGVDGTASRSSQAYRSADEDQKQLFLDTYDPLAYAKYTDAAVLLKLSSNDRFFWLTGAMRNYAGLAGDKRLVITPNSDHNAGGPVLPDPSMDWVRSRLLKDSWAELPRIVGDCLQADGRRFFWEAEGPSRIVRSALYWSPGKTASPARYWKEAEAVWDGGRWTAELPEPFAKMAVQVYATVWDDRNRAVSSPVIERDGNDPQQETGCWWDGGSLWDAAAGASAWRPGTGSAAEIENSGDGGVSFVPVNGTSFDALSNSAMLASGCAASRGGLRLIVHGHGAAGRMTVSLARDGNSLDESVYSATASYAEDETVADIPWSHFRNRQTNEVGRPWPFDTLRIEGERSGGGKLTLRSVQFLST